MGVPDPHASGDGGGVARIVFKDFEPLEELDSRDYGAVAPTANRTCSAS